MGGAHAAEDNRPGHPIQNVRLISTEKEQPTETGMDSVTYMEEAMNFPIGHLTISRAMGPDAARYPKLNRLEAQE